jgi:mannose/fructose-specific phosphotransferase system component IIA
MIVHVVDTTAPVLTAPGDVSVEANAVLSTVAIGTATATDLFAVTITDNAPAIYGLGTTLVTYTATDVNGNVSTATQNVTVADTTAPVLTIPGDVSVEANAVLSSVDIGVATASDIFGATVTNDAPATFPLGTTTVTYTATDGNGLTTVGTQTVTVVDTTAPALTVPGNVSVEANAVLSTVNIGTASATDIFGATVANDAPAIFPLGTTTVTYTATDGNGLITTGTQTVTVVDTTAPALTVPGNVSVEANAVLSTVDIGVATASDTFGATVANDAPATFPLGTTTVTYTATDGNGLTTVGTQTVTVVDTTAPALTVPGNVSVEANAVLSMVNIGTASATDIFGATVANDAPAAFPLGTTTVTYTATDGNGNVTTGTQNVTVVDTIAPVLTVPADVNVEANAVLSTVSIG